MDEQETSSSSEELYFSNVSQSKSSLSSKRDNNVIDSNRALVIAYRTRKLLLTAWKLLRRYRLDKESFKFFA